MNGAEIAKIYYDGCYDQSTVSTLYLAGMIDKAIAEAKKEAQEKCARLCEIIAEERFFEYGTTEDDVGATYYEGGSGEEYQTCDDEDARCAEKIRELKL